MQIYRYVTPRKVLSGAGSLESLRSEVEAAGARHAYVLTTRSLQTSAGLRRVERVLGELRAGTFPACRQHTPQASVEQATAGARACGADLIVAFGGGSVIDTAKVVALRLAERRSEDPLPQVALPTTLSAGEFTAAAGVTDEATGVKNVVADARIVPRSVILDPELSVDTPRTLWLSTGVKAVDHALEALWAARPHLVTDVLAEAALHDLLEYLPASADPSALDSRGRCQVAAWMSIFGMASVGVRLSHPLGHQIGARWDVPHGITSCIVLPEVMRFLHDCPPRGVTRAAQVLRVEPAQAPERLAAFIRELGLPRRLRDTPAKREEIPLVANAVARELAHFGPAGESPSEAELVQLLEAVW